MDLLPPDLFPADKRYFDVVGGMLDAFNRMLDPELLFCTFLLSLPGAGLMLLTADKASMAANAGLLCLAMPVFMLANMLLTFFIMRRAIVLKGIELGKKPARMLDWIVLYIRVIILGCLSWYDLRLWLYAIGWGFAMLVLGTFMGLGAAPIIMLVILGVYAVIGVNMMRLLFANYFLFTSEEPESALPRKSHDLVKGQTLQVAMAYVLPLAVGMAISLFYSGISNTVVRALVQVGIMTPLGALTAVYVASLYKFFCEGAPKPKAHPAKQ